MDLEFSREQICSYNFKNVLVDSPTIMLPSTLWGVHLSDGFLSVILVDMCNTSKNICIKKCILLRENEQSNLLIEIFFDDICLDIPYINCNILNVNDLNLLINDVDKVQFCGNYTKMNAGSSCKIFGLNFTDICENCISNVHGVVQENNVIAKSSSAQKTQEECSDMENLYTCTKCSEKFISLNAIKCHAYVFHNGSLHYTSDTTSTLNDDKSTLPLKSEDSTRKPSACTLCGNTFIERADLKKHELLHVYGNTQHQFQCTVCKKTFDLLDTIMKHYKKLHPAVAYIKCLLCSKCFASGQQLRVHSRKHHSTKQFSCPQCDKKFHKQMLLKEHLFTHTSKAPYTCEICTEKFTRRVTFHKHLASHGFQSNLCYVCGKLFESIAALEDHRPQHFRASVTQHPCNFCQQSFAKKISLLAHLKTYHGRSVFIHSQRDVKCSTYKKCNDHEMQPEPVQKHIKNGIIRCKTCSKSFEKKFRLKIHERTHEERSFVCEKCRKSFSTIGNLNIHQKLHENSICTTVE